MKTDDAVTGVTVKRWRIRLLWLPFILPIFMPVGFALCFDNSLTSATTYSLFQLLSDVFVLLLFGLPVTLLAIWFIAWRISARERTFSIFYSFIGAALGVSLVVALYWSLAGCLGAMPLYERAGAGQTAVIYISISPIAALVAAFAGGVIGRIYGGMIRADSPTK
jgi:hypothetical protein